MFVLELILTVSLIQTFLIRNKKAFQFNILLKLILRTK